MSSPELIYWTIFATLIIIETLGGLMWCCYQWKVDRCHK